MARAPERLKRRERKNITAGVAHVNASFNNTMITITDAQGNAIAWSSAGTMTCSRRPQSWSRDISSSKPRTSEPDPSRATARGTDGAARSSSGPTTSAQKERARASPVPCPTPSSDMVPSLGMPPRPASHGQLRDDLDGRGIRADRRSKRLSVNAQRTFTLTGALTTVRPR